MTKKECLRRLKELGYVQPLPNYDMLNYEVGETHVVTAYTMALRPMLCFFERVEPGSPAMRLQRQEDFGRYGWDGLILAAEKATVEYLRVA